MLGREEQLTFEVPYLYVTLVVAPLGFTVELNVVVVMAIFDADWAVMLGLAAVVVNERTEPYAFPYEFCAIAQK